MVFRRRNIAARIANRQSRIRRLTTSARAGRSWALLAWAVCGSLAAAGADWPTCQCRNDRNAATAERLALPLSAAWVYQARYAPQPAWPPPAKQDFYHGAFDLAPRVDFDLPTTWSSPAIGSSTAPRRTMPSTAWRSARARSDGHFRRKAPCGWRPRSAMTSSTSAPTTAASTVSPPPTAGCCGSIGPGPRIAACPATAA